MLQPEDVDRQSPVRGRSYPTIGIGDPSRIALESAAFVVFTLLSFGAAVHALRQQE